MARQGDGATAKVIFNLGAAVNNDPTSGGNGYTWHCFYRDTAIPDTASVRQVFSCSTPSSNTDATQCQLGFSWCHSAAAFEQAAYQRIDTVNFAAAKITSVLAANTWYSIAATWNRATLSVYLNGALQASSAAGALQFGSQQPLFAALVGAGQNASFARGRIAELAFWNVVLSANQIQALAAGGNPLECSSDGHPAFYAAMLGDSPEPDYSANHRNGTVTAATVANHPGVSSLVRFP